jgi:aspartate-semialdehyde dehydrogenase
MSKEIGELVVKNCTPEEFKDEVDIVFSGLDSDVAEETGNTSTPPPLLSPIYLYLTPH